MAVDKCDLLPDNMIGDRHGLFGIACVVLNAEDNLSAFDAASSVYVFGGQFRAALDLIAGLAREPVMEPTTAIRMSWACAEETQRSKMEGSKAFPTMRTADIASSPKIWRSAPRMEPRSPSPIHTCRRMIGPTTIRE